MNFLLSRVEKAVCFTAAVLLFLLMLVTLVDVIGRDVFNRPLLGATELTELLLVMTTFLLYPIIGFREKHIVVDLIDHWSNRILSQVQRITTAVIGSGVFAIVAWRVWILGMRSIEYSDITPGLRLPIGWVLLAVSVLSGITAVAFLALPMQKSAVSADSKCTEDAFARELI